MNPDLVVTVSDACQDCHRLALRTGADQDDLIVRQLVELVDGDGQSPWDLEVPEVTCNTHRAHH